MDSIVAGHGKVSLLDDLQEQIIKNLSASEMHRLRSVSRVFLRAWLKMRYNYIKLDFRQNPRYPHYQRTSAITRSTSLVQRIQ
jgi:hypothetical protein